MQPRHRSRTREVETLLAAEHDGVEWDAHLRSGAAGVGAAHAQAHWQARGALENGVPRETRKT